MCRLKGFFIDHWLHTASKVLAFILAVGPKNHICRLKKLELRMNKACVHVKRVAFRVRDVNVVHFCELGDRFAQGPDAKAGSLRNIELLINLVEGA